MHMPDDLEENQSMTSDAPADYTEAPPEGADQNELASASRIRRNWHPDLSSLTARFQRARPVSETPTEPIPAVSPVASSSSASSFPTLSLLFLRKLNWRHTRRNRLQDWESWSKFRLWRRTRPLWGSLLMIIAGLMMFGGALFLLSLAFLAQSLWPAILVGGLLLVMGVIQLVLPSYAVITGSIGIVLAIVSLLVASFGGCGIGMLLGVIGSALSIAWRPVKRSRLLAASTSQTS